MQPIIKVILRKDKEIDKKHPVALQIYYKGQRRQIFTGVYVKKKEFKDGIVVSAPNKDYLNQIIINKRNEIEREMLTQIVTSDTVDIRQKGKVSRKNFHVYATDYYNGLKHRCSADYIYRRLAVINDFHIFTGNVSFQAITIDVLKKYEDSLFKRELSRNTINRMFKTIKQVFSDAGVAWMYKSVTYQQPKREFLTMDDVDKFQHKAPNHDVKWYFLIGCHTGLRMSDMNNIKVVTNHGVKRIIIGTTKTGEVVSIKLSDKVAYFLSMIKAPLPATANRILQDLVMAAELGRKVNFHMSRHSFAVNSASMGMPIEVVSKLLGHRSIRTTQIYYKITDTKVDEWMDRWS